MNAEAIKKACQICGNQTKLAAMIGVSLHTVNQWVNGHKKITLENAILIEAATGQGVFVEEIMPHIDLSLLRTRPPINTGSQKTTDFSQALKVHKGHLYIKKAVKDGYLPRPATLLCLDCGCPAQVYDHRDYNRPLDVEPVCHACNVKRGPALPFVHVNDR